MLQHYKASHYSAILDVDYFVFLHVVVPGRLHAVVIVARWEMRFHSAICASRRLCAVKGFCMLLSVCVVLLNQ